MISHPADGAADPMGERDALGMARNSSDTEQVEPEKQVSHDDNVEIAKMLRTFANLLEQQGADGFRERAYRRAAETLVGLDRPVTEILAEGGQKSLMALPGIGKGIAGAIAEITMTGRWSQLERLSGDLEPEQLFLSVPGIGPILAHRLADEFHLETLEDLEAAAVMGDVPIPGLGPRRREAIAAVLAERLGRPMLRRDADDTEAPPVRLLLRVDELYRQKAADGTLRKIAPKRFNPTGEAWLPVLHARHGKWHFTVLFSNTRLAHQLGKTHDWVVAYHHRGGLPEGRSTIVTESSGSMAGKRVVRGRESECLVLASN